MIAIDDILHLHGTLVLVSIIKWEKSTGTIFEILFTEGNTAYLQNQQQSIEKLRLFIVKTSNKWVLFCKMATWNTAN